jgi:hypothetical protein
VRSRSVLTPGGLAWLGVLPSALVVVAAIVLLGPTLGGALFPAGRPGFWASVKPVLPEPTEHARYLIALLGPILLSGIVAGALRVGLRIAPAVGRLLVLATQALVVGSLVVCVVAQRSITYSHIYSYSTPFHRSYFTIPTIIVAVTIGVAIAIALRYEAVSAAVSRWSRERSAWRMVILLIAALFTAIWLLTAINSDGTIGNANPAVADNMPFWLDETFSVLNGRTPLVNFNSQYGQLWPYLSAAVMSVVGTSLGAYTTIMATGSGLALLSIFAVLRRIVRSSLLALALYLPFLATGFFIERGPLDDRYAPSALLSMFPIRYGGPYLLAWLTVRHLSGEGPRRRWLLFLVGGLVTINNPEFGVSGLGATVAAILWTSHSLSIRLVRRLVGSVTIGLGAAAACVSLLTMTRTGSLPDFSSVFTFAKLEGVDGWTMLPMPTIGFHLVVYATFVAAIVVATVRAIGRASNVMLTAMLAWAGVFGLGAGSYFAGRSHPEVLIDLFSAWALALVLLTVVVIQHVAKRPRRLPTLADLAVLVAFGLAVCSIAQTPTPWGQIRRLGHRTATPLLVRNDPQRFVASTTRRGERVALVVPLGHRIAAELGLSNVSPYASMGSITTAGQLDETIAALRRAHGRKLFVSGDEVWPEALAALPADGFVLQRQEERLNGLMEWVDRRPLS